ncbi:unnamed protein product [Arabidopsis arenosa]|uniref:NYN domain-containing protein n=1 Tax=Arabidopsis arenosa TaxID=38785 RepID=A0A8S1ZV02_ARAAE|nr:unnamed protein product [Arabidopsis arenosa]
MMHKGDEEKTFVLWNISKCPIPDGHDPRLVGPRIESALKKSGQWRCRYGPLYITAVGNLTQIPGGDDVLRTLSSTGMALKHAHDVQWHLYEWTEENPDPATIMLITGSEELEGLARTLYDLENQGYRILLAYPQRAPAPDWLWLSFLRDVSKEWLWDSLMSDEDMEDNKQEPTRLVLQDYKHSETGESPWFCSVCDFAAQSFEDFTTHLKSEKHAFSEWDLEASHNNVNRLDPANIEWDLLVSQDIAFRTSQRQGPGPFMPPNIDTMVNSQSKASFNISS